MMKLRLALVLFILICFAIAEFDPYADNSGTIVALAGQGYCILAAGEYSYY